MVVYRYRSQSQSDSEGSVSSGEALLAQPAPVKCRWAGCGEWFSQLELLAGHVTTKHAVPGKGGLFYCHWECCTRSDRGFNARYKMLVHMRTHTNEKPHHCFQCDKSFSRAENLKIHARSHTGERPYVCPVAGCGKAYSNSSDRFKHTRTHSIDKPYVCKVVGCPKRYTDPSSLRKHVKTYRHYPTTNMKERKMEIDKGSWKSDSENRLTGAPPLAMSLLPSNCDISRQAYTPSEESQATPVIAEACYNRTSVVVSNKTLVYSDKTMDNSTTFDSSLPNSRIIGTDPRLLLSSQNITDRMSPSMITDDFHQRVTPPYADQVRHGMPPPLYIEDYGRTLNYETALNTSQVPYPYYMLYSFAQTAPTSTHEQESPLDLSVHH